MSILNTSIQGALGLAVIVLIAAAMSERRGALKPRMILAAIITQLLLGAILLRVPALAAGLAMASKLVSVLEQSALAGATFMFGYLVTGPAPFEIKDPGATFLVAFRVLPLILLMSALSAMLYHVGALPAIIRLIAAGIKRIFRVSGALAFAASASIFFGIIEGPILIKPHLKAMPRAELFALLVCGMSTVAGTVMVLYASVLEPAVPGALGHILVASLMSVPSALLMAHLFIPGEETPQAPLEDGRSPDQAPAHGGLFGALMRGIEEGTRMVVAIVATLIVLFALVHLLNQGLSLLPSWADKPVTIERLVGLTMRPLVWLMGVPWSEATTAAELMGTKTILNEFVAYLNLSKLPQDALSPKSRLVMTYGMCGFANLGSLGILVGGLAPLMPDREQELASLAIKAILAGTLATSMTGAVVAIVAP